MLQHRDTITEMRSVVAGQNLPLYGEGPGVDYTDALVAYGVSITLGFSPVAHPNADPYPINSNTRVLLVERGECDGPTGAWAAVSGYVDVMSDPKGELPDEAFDPVRYAIQQELEEECGIHDQSGIEIRTAEPICVARDNGRLWLVPAFGICRMGRPNIRVDGLETTGFRWPRLGEIALRPNVFPGYVRNLLPKALGTCGLHQSRIYELLKIPNPAEAS